MRNTQRFTLVLFNRQGARDTTYHSTKAGARAQIRSWRDPENMTARVWDQQASKPDQPIYEGKALSFK